MKNQSKATALLVLFLIGVLFFFSACKDGSKRIVGKWERFDDASAGTKLVVKAVGNNFQGKIMSVEGLLSELGFENGDVKWKHIKWKEHDKYEAQDLQKAVNQKGEVAYSEYINIEIKLISEDILHVSEKEAANKTEQQQQKWRRVK